MFVVRTLLLGAAVMHAASATCGKPEVNFLLDYGYLDRDRSNNAEDVRAAVLLFQQFSADYGLNATGECDEATTWLMQEPRCGCEDVPKKETQMIPPFSSGPQEYNVGDTVWSKKRLTWKVIKYPTRNRDLSNSQVDGAMRRGLQIWADQANLYFEQTASDNADIKISFERLRHTTRQPFYDFDGKGGVLAHAFFPQSGVVHFDDDEDFVLGSNRGTELYIVAAHEFGHTLGISHSNDNSALMAPFYRYQETLKLGRDDINAIQKLYGRKPNTVTDKPVNPTPRVTTQPTTPRRQNTPSQCDMIIDASFKIGQVTYVFTTEKATGGRKTYVYKVHERSGLDIRSRKLAKDMFLSRTSTPRRVYPYHVDAAAYMPNIRKVFLITGTKVYRYTVTSLEQDIFYIDNEGNDKYPRWFDVDYMPERPRAAVAMKFGRYFMFLYSETMMWIWGVDNDVYRVSAWAYPIRMFGQLMPHNMDSAFEMGNKIGFVRGDKIYEFDTARRRVLGQDSIKSVKTALFRGPCM